MTQSVEFEQAADVAKRLQVTVRTVQLWAKEGRLPGAQKVGRDWLIPAGYDGPVRANQTAQTSEALSQQFPAAKVPSPASEAVHARESSQVNEESSILPMPLVSSAFEPGTCQAVIDAIPDEQMRALAQTEYCYFSGDAEGAREHAETLLDHPDHVIRFSALFIYSFANLSLGRIRSAKFGLRCVQDGLKSLHTETLTAQQRAIVQFAANATFTLLHLPAPVDLAIGPDAQRDLQQLPQGLRLYAIYVQAHRAYIDGEYERSLGMVESALSLSGETYPIPMIYLHLVATMDLMSLRRPDEAREHFMAAWELSRPDDLIEGIGEHHGLLQGMIESCLKNDFPEDYKRIIDITYRFSAGWRRVHNPETQSAVADNLTTTEFTVAMLANRGWTNKEIAAHMDISANTVKHLISSVYRKLGVSNRRDLRRYMLR